MDVLMVVASTPWLTSHMVQASFCSKAVAPLPLRTDEAGMAAAEADSAPKAETKDAAKDPDFLGSLHGPELGAVLRGPFCNSVRWGCPFPRTLGASIMTNIMVLYSQCSYSIICFKYTSTWYGKPYANLKPTIYQP